MVINRVEEILDEPYEQVVQRVCAIDVAKDSGKVCVRTPAESGGSGSTCWRHAGWTCNWSTAAT